MAYGRKLKGATRRIPITIHAPIGRLEEIDKYVEDRNSNDERAYSRSDFYEEAAIEYMKKLGIWNDEEEA